MYIVNTRLQNDEYYKHVTLYYTLNQQTFDKISLQLLYK